MVYNLRDAHWEYQAPIKVQPPQVADYGQGDTPDPKRRKVALWSPPPPQGKGKGANKGKAPWTAKPSEDKPPLPHTIKYGNAVATETAQGVKICEAFQDGQCPAKGKRVHERQAYMWCHNEQVFDKLLWWGSWCKGAQR